MDFIIVYERLNREYQNAILLKLELETRGFVCDIAQYYQASKFRFGFHAASTIILVPNMYIERNIYRTLSRFGNALHIVNLQYEQVLSAKWEKLGYHNPQGTAGLCKHICWGEKTSKRLIDSGVSKANVKVLGALQLDLLRPKYRTDQQSLREALPENFRYINGQKVVLFLSSFTYADISNEKLKINEDAAGISLRSFVDIHTPSRVKILEWFSSFCADFPETLIIYRPHPDEVALDIVFDMEKRFDNFKVIRDGAAKDWIELSDFAISWYSTTVVETHVMNIPYVILRPFKLPEDFDSVLLKKGKFIKSYTLLFRAYNDFLIGDGNHVKALNDSDINEYYDIGTEPSYIRYADYLVELINSNEVLNLNFSKKKWISAFFNSFGVFFLYYFIIVSEFLGLGVILSKNRKYKFWQSEFSSQIISKKYENEVKTLVSGKLNGK